MMRSVSLETKRLAVPRPASVVISAYGGEPCPRSSAARRAAELFRPGPLLTAILRLFLAVVLIGALLTLAGVTLSRPPATVSADYAANTQHILRSSNPQALAGDTNCDGLVDASDALLILRFGAGSYTSDCLLNTGNVICRDRLDALDALAVLKHVRGLVTELPPLCPAIGLPVQSPPELSLTCDATTIAPNSDIHCSYAAAAYYSDVQLSWSFGDGEEVPGAPAALGVGCPPDHVPCIYDAAGRETIVFPNPGPKTISVTACAGDACADQVWRLTVSGIATPTPTFSPNPTPTHSATAIASPSPLSPAVPAPIQLPATGGTQSDRGWPTAASLIAGFGLLLAASGAFMLSRLNRRER